ncbi:ATP-dependent DNA helicase [Cellulomonas marina]|uniref:ATP-dependent helicase DinG n=1 Tax=Cellulomonas marina TaxID=988821 RepID=A0A1I0VJK4_9CELL|nr:ATP-dependent DNA helicase [Cellulomonas marina]GIG27932.1 hypothetical protein Cma02nite_05320 [Cellulomonas marina]SFA76378.1 ATP-dependent DNA helicase DinG [Cellulomonas marina]
MPQTDRTVPAVGELLDAAVGALGGAPREGQRAMAEAVAAAVEAGEHVLVQAGTGTGKSLAYLVPAVRHAVLEDERVVVSTATLALQRQVVTRDLPLVARALAPRLPRPPQVALLKGWHNYLCLHKVQGGYPADEPGALFALGEAAGAAEHPPPVDADPGVRRAGGGGGGGGETLGQQVVRLREWADETTTGDRDDLVPGVTDRAWRQVSVTAMECLGQQCPLVAECFPEAARTRAREADVVVTNHAMLGIAASGSPGVLPEHHVLVVDEAHELAERVTAQATAELSLATVEHAARLVRRHLAVPTTDLDAAGQALAAALVTLPEGRFPDGLPEGLRDAVAAVRDAVRTLMTATRPEAGATKGPPDGGRKMATGALLALFEVAEQMAADPADRSRTVLWCARGEDRRGSTLTRLHAAPLVVSGLVRTHLLAGRASVLTSATLSLGGAFEPVARSVGLEGPRRRADETAPAGGTTAAGTTSGTTAGGTTTSGAATSSTAVGAADDPTGGPTAGPAEGSGDERLPWRALDVGSPFDYRRQGILYVARHLPPPGREPATEAQLDELAGLVEAAGGRTLGLFSSRRAAEAAALALRERLDVPVLLQGDDVLPSLVARFAADEPTCLFGTLSLWQGVDVPGPTCRLVVIDRIPFPRPDDPVRAARAQAVDRAGGNGFMSVSAAHAALLLAQGAGRLIRSVDDRGVVAVLDPRLVTARYGDVLRRTLPDLWPTSDPALVRDALRRLARPAPAASSQAR